MEVKMGRLALERAQDPAVKRFGQTLITDHSKANQELLQLAQRKGIKLPPEIQEQLNQNESAAAAGIRSDSANPLATDRDRLQRDPAARDTTDRQRVRDAAKTGEKADEEAQSAVREPRDRAGKPREAGELGQPDKSEAMISSLQKLNGRAFDRGFVEHAVKDHEKDVKMFERVSEHCDDSDVKAFAAKTLPTLRQHLETARSLNSGLPNDRQN